MPVMGEKRLADCRAAFRRANRYRRAVRDAARAVLDTVQPGPEKHLVCVDAVALERLKEVVGRGA